jgi:hypothetical protein
MSLTPTEKFETDSEKRNDRRYDEESSSRGKK